MAAPRTSLSFLKTQELVRQLLFSKKIRVMVPDQMRFIRSITAAIPGALCELEGQNIVIVWRPRYLLEEYYDTHQD